MDVILPFVLIPTFLILALLIFTALGLLQSWKTRLPLAVVIVLDLGLILTWFVTMCMFFPYIFSGPVTESTSELFSWTKLGDSFLLCFLLCAPLTGTEIAPWLATRGFILAPAAQPTSDGKGAA